MALELYLVLFFWSILSFRTNSTQGSTSRCATNQPTNERMDQRRPRSPTSSNVMQHGHSGPKWTGWYWAWITKSSYTLYKRNGTKLEMKWIWANDLWAMFLLLDRSLELVGLSLPRMNYILSLVGIIIERRCQALYISVWPQMASSRRDKYGSLWGLCALYSN